MSEASFGPEGAIEFPQASPHSPNHTLQPAELIPTNAPRPLAEVAAWLRDSPNNPDYIHSELYQSLDDWLVRHENAIDSQVKEAAKDLGFEYAWDDIQRINALRTGEHQSDDMFTAYDIAYPQATKDIVEEFQDTTAEDGRETINNRAVRAVGATMLRAEYMSQLAERFSAALSVEGRPDFTGYSGMYRQNILAIIQRATRLESLAPPSPEIPDLRVVA